MKMTSTRFFWNIFFCGFVLLSAFTMGQSSKRAICPSVRQLEKEQVMNRRAGDAVGQSFVHPAGCRLTSVKVRFRSPDRNATFALATATDGIPAPVPLYTAPAFIVGEGDTIIPIPPVDLGAAQQERHLVWYIVLSDANSMYVSDGDRYSHGSVCISGLGCDRVPMDAYMELNFIDPNEMDAPPPHSPSPPASPPRPSPEPLPDTYDLHVCSSIDHAQHNHLFHRYPGQVVGESFVLHSECDIVSLQVLFTTTDREAILFITDDTDNIPTASPLLALPCHIHANEVTTIHLPHGLARFAAGKYAWYIRLSTSNSVYVDIENGFSGGMMCVDTVGCDGMPLMDAWFKMNMPNAEEQGSMSQDIVPSPPPPSTPPVVHPDYPDHISAMGKACAMTDGVRNLVTHTTANLNVLIQPLTSVNGIFHLGSGITDAFFAYGTAVDDRLEVAFSVSRAGAMQGVVTCGDQEKQLLPNGSFDLHCEVSLNLYDEPIDHDVYVSYRSIEEDMDKGQAFAQLTAWTRYMKIELYALSTMPAQWKSHFSGEAARQRTFYLVDTDAEFRHSLCPSGYWGNFVCTSRSTCDATRYAVSGGIGSYSFPGNRYHATPAAVFDSPDQDLMD